MNKHCGQTKFLFSLVVAALFCLTLAAPNSSAQQIKIGAGVEDPCWNGNAGVPSPTPAGWCDVVGGEVNAVLGNSFDWYQNSDSNTNIVSPLFLIFAVPVENLLFPFFGGNEFNGPVTGSALTDPGTLVEASALPCFPDCSAELAAGSPVGVSFPGSFPIDYSSYFTAAPNMFPVGFPGGFEQGTLFALGETGASGVADGNTSLYDFMGLPANSVSMNIGNWTNLSQEVPNVILGCGPGNPICEGPDDFIRPSGWNLWVFLLDHNDLLDQGDAIEILFDEAQLPLGTWVSGWAVGEKCTGGHPAPTRPNCDKNYFGMAVTESALLMPLNAPPPPGVPEPTSLLLLGTGLLAVGKKLRKRQKEQDQKTV